MKKCEREDGFTLIEILVVILIIGILASIAVAVFLNQKKASQEASVKSDLKNLGVEFETALANSSTGTYPETIPADFKRSEGNVFAITSESGNTNLAAGTQKTATTFNQGTVGFHSTPYAPTRTFANGIWHTSYTSSETRNSSGGHYWQFLPSANVVASEAFTGRVTVRSSEDVCFRLQFEMHKPEGGPWQTVSGQNTCISANTWTPVEVSGVTPYEVRHITMIAYSIHTPGSTFEYRDPIIVMGDKINDEQFNVSHTQRFCVQGYNLNDTSNIWHYSALNGGVEKGRC